MLMTNNTLLVNAAADSSINNENLTKLEEEINFEQVERLKQTPNDVKEAKHITKSKIDIPLTKSKRQMRTASNDNPNGAYLLPFNTTITDNINVAGESRWYGVIAEKKSRISTMMVADNTVNFDLYVYILDQESATLNLIGYSNNAAGQNEIVDMIVDEGIYYIEIYSTSGVGNCALASYLSTDYIDNEINDTVELASDLQMNGVTQGAVDSPIDMDVYKFTISTEASRCRFTLQNPENCNYALYMVRGSTGAMYSVTSGTLYLLECDDYYLIVASTDETYNAAMPYSLSVSSQNCVTGARELLSYNGYLLQQKGNSGLEYYINGIPIDFNYTYTDDFSYGDDYMHARMTLTTKSTSEVYNKYFTDINEIDHAGIQFIKYKSSFNNSSRNVALYIPINDVTFAYHRTASASMAPTSVHQSFATFAEVIVDVNTGKVIDLFSPNWYYESSASNHTHSIVDIYAICENE